MPTPSLLPHIYIVQRKGLFMWEGESFFAEGASPPLPSLLRRVSLSTYTG